jgi:proteasome lid subunit RPN8/RPN11
MKPRLLIPRAIHSAILAQAAAEAPNECCGILAGTMPAIGADYQIAVRLPLVNALHSPTAFESEPRGLLEAHRTMRASGWEILAVYHSHPNSAPIPSRKDCDLSFSADVATVIVSLHPTPELRAWWICNGEIHEAHIEIA